MAWRSTGNKPAITIKKYANRRLYDTESSSYVTLEYLCDLVKAGRDFAVIDARSGADITPSVLLQIIAEEEGRGHHLLPAGFLRDLIGCYSNGLADAVPGYLEASMRQLTRSRNPSPADAAVTYERNWGQAERAGEPDASAPQTANQRKDPCHALGKEFAAIREQLNSLQIRVETIARNAADTK